MSDNVPFMLPMPGKHLLSSSNVNMMNNIVMLPKKRHKFIPFSLAEYSEIIQKEDAMIISIENLMAYIDGHDITLPPEVTPTVLREVLQPDCITLKEFIDQGKHCAVCNKHTFFNTSCGYPIHIKC